MQTNQVKLVGYVAKDLRSTTTRTGRKRTYLRVVTYHHYKGKDGDHAQSSAWHDVVAWGQAAVYAEKNFVKGSHIMVDGSISYARITGKDGSIRCITEISAHSLLNLDR